MDWQERFLRHRVHEEWVWRKLHVDTHATEADALTFLHDQCGFTDGGCRYVASEYCILDCPFRLEEWGC